MNLSVIKLLVITTIAIIGFQSCEEENGNETKISYNNSTESHKAGQDCMTCHKSGGSGEGWFTVAGTVYDESKEQVKPNVIVKLYSGTNGTGDLVATIEVDGKGNFYTTEKINFDNGLYTLVESNTDIQHMTSSITAGSCNSCHGNLFDRIWVN